MRTQRGLHATCASEGSAGRLLGPGKYSSSPGELRPGGRRPGPFPPFSGPQFPLSVKCREESTKSKLTPEAPGQTCFIKMKQLLTGPDFLLLLSEQAWLRRPPGRAQLSTARRPPCTGHAPGPTPSVFITQFLALGSGARMDQEGL